MVYAIGFHSKCRCGADGGMMETIPIPAEKNRRGERRRLLRVEGGGGIVDDLHPSGARAPQPIRHRFHAGEHGRQTAQLASAGQAARDDRSRTQELHRVTGQGQVKGSGGSVHPYPDATSPDRRTAPPRMQHLQRCGRSLTRRDSESNGDRALELVRHRATQCPDTSTDDNSFRHCELRADFARTRRAPLPRNSTSLARNFPTHGAYHDGGLPRNRHILRAFFLAFRFARAIRNLLRVSRARIEVRARRPFPPRACLFAFTAAMQIRHGDGLNSQRPFDRVQRSRK